MNALTFRLDLLEPVLATQPASGEENSSNAYGFVPGATLRGALIAQYQRAHPDTHLATDAVARRLFFDGTTRFLNAYPLLPETQTRMLPTPLAWYVLKSQSDDERATIFDFGVREDTVLDPIKNVKDEFCAREAEIAQLYTARRQINVHNVSEDRVRKQAETSNVYRYEAIAADETLSAAIVSDALDDLCTLQALLPERLLLGGAHTAGYGHVAINDVQIHEDWREYEPDEHQDEIADWVIVTLLSDAIVRNADGHNGADFDAALARTLGMAALQHVRAYQRLRPVGGFNRTAGLPLAQDWAIQAGSVFVYRATDLSLERLRDLETQGIGERRAEGFGRLAVNWHTRPQFTRQPYAKSRALARSLTLTRESQTLAQRMAQRRLRTLLDQKLVSAVNRKNIQNAPENAQLSRVRSAAQQAMAQSNLDDVIKLMNSLKGAKAQFENARVDGIPMFEWICRRAEQCDLETQLQLQPGDFPRVAGLVADLAPLRVEYMARLIDGVMQKAIREKRKSTSASRRKEAS